MEKMTKRQMRTLLRQQERLYQKNLDDFKKVVESMPFIERVKLAWRIVWRCI